MPTITERENLMRDVKPSRTGFTPRQVQTLATKKKPHMTIDIECNHFLRASTDEATHGVPPLSYRMWQEASKHDPPFPDRPDEQYNSNVWRNFRRQYGFHVNSDGQKISDMIANMYPLNIPAPSKVGSNTYEKFLRENISLIRDEKLRRMALERTKRDVDEFKRLRLRSDNRNPPIDPDGAILPPQDFKLYPRRFIPPDDTDFQTPPTPLPQGEMRVDLFGRKVPRARPEPHLWRLAYKLNHPEYKRLQEEIETRKSMPKRNPPVMSVGKVQ